MNNIVLNATEVFQLAALGPCLFVMVYLFFSTKRKFNIVIPILYFISITCTFLLPIMSFFPVFNMNHVRTALIFNENLEPELGFLLVSQFILRKPPPFVYWLVLALPLIGGGSFLYLSILQRDMCFGNDMCVFSESLMVLYRIIGSSFIFLLLITFLKKTPKIDRNDTSRRHKYWMIIMLILYNLALLGVDLVLISGYIVVNNALFIKTMISVSFVYLVLSSIFRVFNRNLDVEFLPNVFADRDEEIARKISNIIQNEKPYRILGFNRGVLSDKLGLTEQHLSRIINTRFEKSFSELMNEYRIAEAKELLINSDNSITTISFDVGFNSITSFNRVFKNKTGLSPSKYRSTAL